jgi:hypothetical protein
VAVVAAAELCRLLPYLLESICALLFGLLLGAACWLIVLLNTVVDVAGLHEGPAHTAGAAKCSAQRNRT